ncbi:MAG TPA: hypothetical protein VJ987_04785 [Anaerolineales bacterium]|nr:hypothetical protein [Anaerolineales bacterium]
MSTRLTIILSDQEKSALISLSEREKREPGDQAALLIRERLAQEGLIDISQDVFPTEQISESST